MYLEASEGAVILEGYPLEVVDMADVAGETDTSGLESLVRITCWLSSITCCFASIARTLLSNSRTVISKATIPHFRAL